MPGSALNAGAAGSKVTHYPCPQEPPGLMRNEISVLTTRQSLDPFIRSWTKMLIGTQRKDFLGGKVVTERWEEVTFELAH